MNGLTVLSQYFHTNSALSSNYIRVVIRVDKGEPQLLR